MSVNQKILDAIELLAASSVEKAGYDRTIQAQILSCEDATIGKYRCRYQDAVFYAYANNLDMTFANGSYVYILVPGNDMSKEKTILGTTQKLGINYISQVEGDQAYDIIGNNCITSNNIYYLDTIKKDYSYILYKYNELNDTTLDIVALEQYIKQSSSIIVGATFKTAIPLNRQYRGHYGITYYLRFLDNTSNKQVIRSYTIDEDNMIDNPYKLIHRTRQYQIFEVDGLNFIRVEAIEIFCRDFPNATEIMTGEKLVTGDIQISALQLFGANRMSENQINGVAISFYTPQGTFFINSSTINDYKTITAQIKIKGKLVSTTQRIPFYWGSENVGVSSSSEYYNKYLGRGWKCLNDKNVIQAATATTDPVIEWIPGKDTYILNFSVATAKNNKFKVAAVYDGTVITKEINIQNLGLDIPELTIESNSGTKFYYDVGHPTLTCKINGEEKPEYKYYWGYENNIGVFEQLLETTDLNNEYTAAINALNELQADIANGIKFANAENENLSILEDNIKAFNVIQRVSGNKIYDIQINNITSFGIFKCSVYNDQDVYLGTASIVLTNSFENENSYSLIINNGSAVFQYNENGVAPNSKSLDIQQEIQGLSFTIYDNLGQPISSEIIANTNNCKIRWQFPIKDTMLVDQAANGPDSGMDDTETYKYYDNKINLIYGIAQKYDIKKQRNQIRLIVDYKGMNLTAETDFTFTKQGQPGTNGTEYLVKLIPNTKLKNPPLWPMITKAGNNYYLNYGINTGASQQQININSSYLFFIAQLWHSGQLVWQGKSAATAALDGISKPSVVYWQVLKNKYNSTTSDASAFEITNPNNGGISYLGDHLASALTTPLANIIKCSITWQGKTYYGTIPIITAWTNNARFRVGLKEYTGFRYVIYASDGTYPQYDNAHPFEFICSERINNTLEDISLVEGDHSIEYEVSSIGNYLSTKDGSPTDSNLLEILRSDIYRKDCAKNQWMARPAQRYDGACVNVAICCIYKQNGIIIGKINVPIHYLLNKYGLANINEWDGNSIQIDDEGGFILSPQIGSGQKENDNSFTGILMGEVRNAGKSSADVGLLGYSKGDRTFFLNSKNGSALFGKSNQAQITIDPTTDRALIYSGNFWKNNFYDPETGLPNYGNYDSDEFYKNYRSEKYSPNNNTNKEGLIIDLTTPEIFFGTGNFYVTKEGYIHATAGGNIGGWKIDNHSLYSNIEVNNGRITLDAGTYDENEGTVTGPGKIYSHNHSNLTSTNQGFYLSYDGISFGNKAKITSEGTAYFGIGAVDGSNDKHWIINGNDNESYIAYRTNSWTQANTSGQNVSKIYLGTNGLSLGNKFSVTPEGKLKAYDGVIGGWQITSTSLYNEVKINDTSWRVQLDRPSYGQTWVFSTRYYDKSINNWRGTSYISAKGDAYFHGLKVAGVENHNGTVNISKINFIPPCTITINGSGFGPDKSINWAYFRDKNGKYFGVPAVLVNTQPSLVKVGDIINYSGTANLNISQGETWTNVASITLQPGTWIITYGCTVPGGGMVTCALVGPSKYIDSGIERVSIEGKENAWYTSKGTTIIKIPETVTFTLQAWSPVARNITRPNLRAVKIGWEQ